MSYYELPAEERGYFLFAHRPLGNAGAHFHSAPEFVFMERGEAEVNLDGETRLLTAGSACFADSFSVHSYRDRGSSAYVLLGDKYYFERFFRGQDGKTFPAFFSFNDFAALDTLYRLCGGIVREENARTVFGGAAEMLCGLLAEHVPTEPKRANSLSVCVCEILRYAENNTGGDLSLAALSKRFGYTREHLSRILHRYLRENWNAYVNRLRVTKAESVLRENGSANVLQIACDCGFESLNTFYRAYKKEFGKSPRRPD